MGSILGVDRNLPAMRKGLRTRWLYKSCTISRFLAMDDLDEGTIVVQAISRYQQFQQNHLSDLKIGEALEG